MVKVKILIKAGEKTAPSNRSILPRTWFLARGCKLLPMEFTRGHVRWGHPDGYFLRQNGTKVADDFPPARREGKKSYTHGKKYPKDRTIQRDMHILMAIAFYGPRPDEAEIGVTKKRSDYQCHHLIPDNENYCPANLLCWLTLKEHKIADKRQKELQKVLPDMHVLSYDYHRDLQDPRETSDEKFKEELDKLREKYQI